MPPPKRRKHLSSSLSTRELIIDIAEKLIAIHGIDGLKPKDIADEIGIQVPSLYAHFPDREAILNEIGKRIFKGFEDDFDQVDRLPPREALREHTRLLVRRYAKNRSYVLILLADLATPQGIEALNACEGILNPYYQRLTSVLDRGYDEGVFKKTQTQEFIASRIGIILINIAFYYEDRCLHE